MGIDTTIKRSIVGVALRVSGLAVAVVLPKLCSKLCGKLLGRREALIREYYPREALEMSKTSTSPEEYALAHSADFEDALALLEDHRNQLVRRADEIEALIQGGGDVMLTGDYRFKGIKWQRTLRVGAMVINNKYPGVSRAALTYAVPILGLLSTVLGFKGLVFATSAVASGVETIFSVGERHFYLLDARRKLHLSVGQVNRAVTSWTATAVRRHAWGARAGEEVTVRLYHDVGRTVADERENAEGTLGTRACVDRHRIRQLYTEYHRDQEGFTEAYMAAVVQKVRHQCTIRTYNKENFQVALHMVSRVMLDYSIKAWDEHKRHAARLVIFGLSRPDREDDEAEALFADEGESTNFP